MDANIRVLITGKPAWFEKDSHGAISFYRIIPPLRQMERTHGIKVEESASGYMPDKIIHPDAGGDEGEKDQQVVDEFQPKNRLQRHRQQRVKERQRMEQQRRAQRVMKVLGKERAPAEVPSSQSREDRTVARKVVVPEKDTYAAVG